MRAKQFLLNVSTISHRGQQNFGDYYFRKGVNNCICAYFMDIKLHGTQM